MATVTLTLTQSELNEAIKDWVEARGFDVTDRTSVSVNTVKGDRPFDNGYTSATVSGVYVNATQEG